MINHMIKLLYIIFGLIDDTDCTIPCLNLKNHLFHQLAYD